MCLFNVISPTTFLFLFENLLVKRESYCESEHSRYKYKTKGFEHAAHVKQLACSDDSDAAATANAFHAFHLRELLHVFLIPTRKM